MSIRIPPDTLASSGRFEGVREVVGHVEGAPRGARAMLAQARLRCQRGGQEHDVLHCVQCKRFVNYVPAPDRKTLTVRCLWTARDPVSDMMTLASELLAVEPTTRVVDAAAFARERGVHHLFVAADDELAGIVCRCDLVPPVDAREIVADRMTRRVWMLPITATLGEAADVMLERDVSLLPVVADGEIRGVITRTDLIDAGIDDRFLGVRRCSTCGSAHGARPHPTLPHVEFCLDCLDRLGDATAADEE